MKTIFTLIMLIWPLSDEQFIIINDILYEMPIEKINKIKANHTILDQKVFHFNTKTDSCFSASIDWIDVGIVDPESRKGWSVYSVETVPYFIYKEIFVDIDYFFPADIESFHPLPKKEAIEKFGCKGVNPIFILMLKEGKTIQKKPVGGIILRRQ